MADSTTINIVNTATNKLRPWTYVAKDIITALNAAEIAATTQGDAENLGVLKLSDDYTSTTAAASNVSAGVAATPKAVYDAFEAAKSYTDSAVTSVYRFKGSVNTVAHLPSTDNEVGDFYNVTASGENYAWTGSDWDIVGNIVDLQNITNAEIDTIMAS